MAYGAYHTTIGVIPPKNPTSSSTAYANPFISSSSPIFNAPESACDGKKDGYYDLGYGVEHTYTGEIQPGKSVTIVLSCDHLTMTITGAVQQVITAKSLFNYTSPEIDDLADLSSGDQVIDTNSDFNFDGYNDLSTVAVSGNGAYKTVSYYIFLYNPSSKRFVFSPALSNLTNISVNKDEKYVASYGYNGYDGHDATFYKYKSDGSLYKYGYESCTTNIPASDMKLDQKRNFTLIDTYYNPDGTTATTSTMINSTVPGHECSDTYQ